MGYFIVFFVMLITYSIQDSDRFQLCYFVWIFYELIKTFILAIKKRQTRNLAVRRCILNYQCYYLVLLSEASILMVIHSNLYPCMLILKPMLLSLLIVIEFLSYYFRQRQETTIDSYITTFRQYFSLLLITYAIILVLVMRVTPILITNLTINFIIFYPSSLSILMIERRHWRVKAWLFFVVISTIASNFFAAYA